MYSLRNSATLKKSIAEKLDSNFLNKDEEYTLIKEWQKNKDQSALKSLITAHNRLIKKIAKGYSGYGIPMDDLISEGYVGLIQAANSFSIESGFRFSTYLTKCIKTFLQRYAMKLASIISVKPNNENKKLFFQLKRIKNEQGILSEDLAEREIDEISKKLNVSKENIKIINNHISLKNFSLNHKVNDDSSFVEYQDMIKDDKNFEDDILNSEEFKVRKKMLLESLKILNSKEFNVLRKRRLSENPKTLQEIADDIGCSKERIRQIEKSAFLKLQKHIKLIIASNDSSIYCVICILC